MFTALVEPAIIGVSSSLACNRYEESWCLSELSKGVPIGRWLLFVVVGMEFELSWSISKVPCICSLATGLVCTMIDDVDE